MQTDFDQYSAAGRITVELANELDNLEFQLPTEEIVQELGSRSEVLGRDKLDKTTQPFLQKFREAAV